MPPIEEVRDRAVQDSTEIESVESIEAQILGLLASRVPAGVQVSATTRLVRGLGLDSVALLDFIMDLEDRFDISIPLDRVAEVETVAELSRAVAALMRAAG